MRTFSARSLQRILDYYRGSGEIDWMAIFHPVDSSGAHLSKLREIILYHAERSMSTDQPVGSEFVELDWTAMDLNSLKSKSFQTVQRQLLATFPDPYLP